ncbi:hypothetical protein [Paraburkholderia sp. BCC1886]|uniref:hypothetical protein n=1 Tax=Paraburkholderia sp. BCC1886 TaxID=2562670 RepID=UPI0011823605|nr:hypothetical protein [Paraburkholderia sp. BCC1886]
MDIVKEIAIGEEANHFIKEHVMSTVFADDFRNFVAESLADLQVMGRTNWPVTFSVVEVKDLELIDGPTVRAWRMRLVGVPAIEGELTEEKVDEIAEVMAVYQCYIELDHDARPITYIKVVKNSEIQKSHDETKKLLARFMAT